MAALTSKALHEQLCIIMAALTKAAVAEICEVVDDGYAVLHMEISRSHKENEDLRKKLHLIESIVVRGNNGGGAAAAEAEVAPTAAVGAQHAETQPPPPLQQRAESDGGAPAADPGRDGGATVTVVVREELPDVVLIKDEDSDSDESWEEDKNPAAAREAVPSTPFGRSKKRRWPGGGEGDRKLTQKASKATAGTPQTTVYALDSPGGERGHSSQLIVEEMEAGESVCSYASQMDPDVQLVHQECSLVPSGANRQPAYFGNGALMESPSPTSRAELDLSLTWTKQSKGQMSFTPFHPNENQDGDAFGIKLISVSGSASTDSQPSKGSSSALEYDSGDALTYALYRDQSQLNQQGGGGARAAKRFVCAVCSRTYATAQNLAVHLRIHTGQRPFSCEQCGKKFTQSAHLKSHLSVHSGERPYVCTLCPRSFIVKYSLKLHMKKCHPNVLSE